MPEKQDKVERKEELFKFLQGTVPDGTKIPKSHVPNLTPDQAWAVIWFIQEMHWELPDSVERCDVCGQLYDTDSDGDYLDYGEAPYHFCGSCCNGPEAKEKRLKHSMCRSCGEPGKPRDDDDEYIQCDSCWGGA